MRLRTAIAVLMVVSCSGQGADVTTVPTTPASASIRIENFDFGDPVETLVGAEVTVSNADGVPHTWTAENGEFDSGPLNQGEEFSFTFNEPREYEFFCSIHPTMTGIIRVGG